jgi:hypothetical protein
MMKKTLFLPLLLMLFTALVSCEKNKPCNCGVITDDEILTDANGDFLYTLTIKNDCSGNLGTYNFSYDVWFDANVGEDFCVTNVSSWVPVKPGTTKPIKKEGKTIIHE